MTRCKTWLLGLMMLASLPAFAAESADDKAIQKTIKSLVNAIRYGKDDIAAKQLAFEDMSKTLLADKWANLSADEQKETVSDLEILLRKLSFNKGKEMFQYLDAVLYEPAAVTGESAHVKSTVVIHRDLKKSEIPIEWVLIRRAGQWKVMDTLSMGESTLQGIREGEVEPLLKQGGVPAVMEAMRKRVAEAKKS